MPHSPTPIRRWGFCEKNSALDVFEIMLPASVHISSRDTILRVITCSFPTILGE